MQTVPPCVHADTAIIALQNISSACDPRWRHSLQSRLFPSRRRARREMDDAEFRRDRLRVAVTRLGERLRELRAQEEDDRRRANYEQVKAKRDKLAAELADTYPGIERQLVDLFARLDANDKEVNYLNTRLPTNTERLRLAELVARGLPGLVKNGTQIERMTEQLFLPAFE